MINRRDFLGITAGAGASLALTPELLRALEQQSGKLLQRAIPSSGEMLPVISFAPRPTAPPGPGEIKPMPTDVPAAKQVLKTFIDNGGRVVDVLHGGPIGENFKRVFQRFKQAVRSFVKNDRARLVQQGTQLLAPLRLARGQKTDERKFFYSHS